MTYPIELGIDITNPKDANSVKVGISSNVEVQTLENPSIFTNRHFMNNKATQVCKEDTLPKFKQEGNINMVRKDDITRTPYLHPNHKNRYFNQSMYQYRFEQNQLTYIPKNINSDTIRSCCHKN